MPIIRAPRSALATIVVAELTPDVSNATMRMLAGTAPAFFERLTKGDGITDTSGSSFWQDNPVKKWTSPEGKARAQEWLEGAKNKPTAGYKRIEMDPREVAKLPGQRGEHNRIDQPKVDRLAADMKQRGYREDEGGRVFVNVEHDGTANINEGNHRTRAAIQAGLPKIPVEVRYYGGGEEHPNAWHPKIEKSMAKKGIESLPTMSPKDFADVRGESHAGFVCPEGHVHTFDAAETHGEALRAVGPGAHDERSIRVGRYGPTNHWDTHYGPTGGEFFSDPHHQATAAQHAAIREIGRRTERDGAPFRWQCLGHDEDHGGDGEGVAAYDHHFGFTKSLAKAFGDDKAKGKDKKPGAEQAQPEVKLEVQPGPTKNAHDAVEHGDTRWDVIKEGPLAGRPVRLRRREDGNYTIATRGSAQQLQVSPIAGQHMLAEPSAAHKALYPAEGSEDEPVHGHVGASLNEVQDLAPGTRVTSPEELREAGVEPWHRSPSIGTGHWAEPGMPAETERDLDLHGSGTRRSMRYATALLGKNGKQQATYLWMHNSKGKDRYTTIPLDPGLATNARFEDALKDAMTKVPGYGYHVAYDDRGFPAELVIGTTGGAKPHEHAARMHRVKAVLEHYGLKVGEHKNHKVDFEAFCGHTGADNGQCTDPAHGGTPHSTYDSVLARGHGYRPDLDPDPVGSGRDSGDGPGPGGSADRGTDPGGTGSSGPGDSGGGVGEPGVRGRDGSDSDAGPVSSRAADNAETDRLIGTAARRAGRNRSIGKWKYSAEDRKAIRALEADPSHVERIVRTYKGLEPKYRTGGQAWYTQERAWLKKTAADSGYDTKRLAGAVAALSPQVSWPQNKRALASLLSIHKSGDDMPLTGEQIGVGLSSYHANIVRAWRILDGESPDVVLDATMGKSGAKSRNFFRNLAGNQHAVTVDRWAFAGATGRKLRDKEKIAPRKYEMIANAYRKAAARVGITPEAMQAAVWIGGPRISMKTAAGHTAVHRQKDADGNVTESYYRKSQVLLDLSR